MVISMSFAGKRSSKIGDDLFRKRVEDNQYLHGECIHAKIHIGDTVIFTAVKADNFLDDSKHTRLWGTL